MNRQTTKEIPWGTTLRYLVVAEDPKVGSFGSQPERAQFTSELEIGVYIDDDSIGPPPSLVDQPLQVQISGSARALEEFGRYLIALAHLETANPTPHDHYEDVGNSHGGTLHLIAERVDPEGH